MTDVPKVTLKEGIDIPIIGFGTWGFKGEKCKASLRNALEIGYDHIDTAEGYKNESEIGKVLEDYNRSDLFITSKVLPSNLHYDDVIKACESSLDRLGTSYLDLYLIHWPNGAISVRETLHAMKRLEEDGKVRSVGVSNFSIYQLKIAQKVSEVPICVNQVEFHPWYYQKDLLEYCSKQEVVVTASAPLARTKLLGDETIKKLAKKYGKTPAQIALKWEVQKGVVTIPKSGADEHIKENFQLFGWEIESGDMVKIDGIRKMEKVYNLNLDSEIYGIPT